MMKMTSATDWKAEFEHIEWLSRMCTGDRPVLVEATVMAAEDVRMAMMVSLGQVLSVPAASTGPDGRLLYCWNKGPHHLEVEFIPEQPVEFFYRNRNTREFWGEDHEIGNPIPTMVVEVLELIQ